MKIRRMSISRSGFKTEKLDIDTQTIALLILEEKEKADKFKEVYINRLKENGINVEY